MSFEIELKGLDALKARLADTEKGTRALAGDIELTFNTHDDEAVAAAIRQVEQTIDERAAPYRGNLQVIQIAQEMKRRYIDHINEKVRDARAEREDA
jgi:saccharopine dehydrogenase-like NADP-dependent oxidoreductase